ncbi:MAG: HesA/MoeB/ThiF family protein [Halanaerobiales bacterium]|nr:HesA/MoeB/ThiF family protein [Halanaerobiales bacterium]
MKEYLKRQKELFTKKENKRISNLNVMIGGVGGLGTHQAQQLQRIGVNKIYLYDYDKIEESNLNRQVFYGRKHIGDYKVNIAKKYLQNFNLDTELITSKEKINSDLKIPDDVQLVFDGLDNFESRYILEDLAIEKGIPFVHGGTSSWYGQVVVIVPGETLRLKDIFKGVEDRENTPSVFSPVVSTVASLQVIEGLKAYLKKEEFLNNKLLLIDLMSYEIEKVNIAND